MDGKSGAARGVVGDTGLLEGGSVAEKVKKLSTEDQERVFAEVVRGTPPEEKSAVIVGSLGAAFGTLASPDAQREVLSDAVRTMARKASASRAEVIGQTIEQVVADAPEEAKRDVAMEAASKAVRSLDSSDAKKATASAALESLTPEDRRGVARDFVPDQSATNRIWLIIVWAFAIVFVLSAVALFAAAFWNPDQIQILLTVITTIAGILAGVISGRAITAAADNAPK